MAAKTDRTSAAMPAFCDGAPSWNFAATSFRSAYKLSISSWIG